MDTEHGVSSWSVDQTDFSEPINRKADDTSLLSFCGGNIRNGVSSEVSGSQAECTLVRNGVYLFCSW